MEGSYWGDSLTYLGFLPRHDLTDRRDRQEAAEPAAAPRFGRFILAVPKAHIVYHCLVAPAATNGLCSWIG